MKSLVAWTVLPWIVGSAGGSTEDGRSSGCSGNLRFRGSFGVAK